jgi:hypothetical protein
MPTRGQKELATGTVGSVRLARNMDGQGSVMVMASGNKGTGIPGELLSGLKGHN